MPFQDLQNDIPIKKRLVKLLKENADKNFQIIKVQGTTTPNAKSFDDLEKILDTYLLFLDELFGFVGDEEIPESKYNKLYTKIKRTSFDLKKSLKKTNPKFLTNGENEIIVNYKNKLIELNTQLENLVEPSIINDNNEIIKLCEIINTRVKLEIPINQFYSSNDIMTGSGFFPKRYN